MNKSNYTQTPLKPNNNNDNNNKIRNLKVRSN